MAELFSPVSALKGVGAAKAAAYLKLGIETPYDLLFHFPRHYTDFSAPVPVCDVREDETNVIRAEIAGKLPPVYIRKNFVIYTAVIRDDTGMMKLIMYNTGYRFDSLQKGQEYYISGKVRRGRKEAEILSPEILPVGSGELIMPVYPLARGLYVNQVRNNVREALSLMDRKSIEWLPEKIIKKYSLLPLGTAIDLVHFPKSMDDVRAARKRLAFDESFQLQLGMMMMRRRKTKAETYTTDSSIDIGEFTESLDFELTEDQKRAVEDIRSDMIKNTPMNRLMQGDVGSGKTVVAAAAMYLAARSGVQSVIMAPTEILARQHLATMKGFFDKFGFNTVLLTSSLRAAERRSALEEIAAGRAQIIVGTNAVMQKGVEYKNLGLVITDEQHRFGVGQRKALAEKGRLPHKLVMSATPIPRTLALMMYGELDLSVIHSMPRGRLPVNTFAVTGKMRQRAYGFIEKELSAGHQAYVICPLIGSENEGDDKKSVTEYTQTIKKYFPARRIAMLHGKMSSAAKEGAMADFKEGRTDILVSTTVVEVGVDVPNATVMMIEAAENFGLSQLHQLRGRVGRGDLQSYCILICDKTNEESRERLRTLCSTNDGFRLAEEDLKLRGAGDFFGNRQHGLPQMKIADLSTDIDLFRVTREEAKALIERDPELEKRENRGLKLEVLKMFAKAGAEGLD